ncbi:MAG: PQQ-dependent sugar dehydrogenase [Balneolaceae bacterium]
MKPFYQLIAIFVIFITVSACSMPRGPVPLSGEVPEAEGWALETVAEGLQHPWALQWLPDGEMLITERSGQLLIVNPETGERTSLNGLPDVYASGQGGLMDVALHPGFEQNGWVYLTYSTGHKDANRTTLGRGVLNRDTQALDEFEELFRVDEDKTGDQHFGSRILWLPDQTLLLTLADGGNYIRFRGRWIREQAQNPTTHLGSVLHLTEEGRAATDGHISELEFALPEIYTYGHRNVQGIARDPESGRIWANEHGSRGGDELNLLIPGANYGWPVATYSREYHYPRISPNTTVRGMEDPRVVWTPAQAPSGLLFYTGDLFPEWHGDLFSGGLRGQQVRRIILEGDEVVGEESIPVGERVRDVRQGPEGAIYLLTDEENGRVLRLVPDETP